MVVVAFQVAFVQCSIITKFVQSPVQLRDPSQEPEAGAGEAHPGDGHWTDRSRVELSRVYLASRASRSDPQTEKG